MLIICKINERVRVVHACMYVFRQGQMLSAATGAAAAAVIHYTPPTGILETLNMSPDESSAVHSPIELPSTAFLNNHISGSVIC